MASEYYKWLARNEKPAEKKVLTKEEKRKNWWYYNKNYVIAGCVLCILLADLLFHSLGIGQTRPDYTVAFVGSRRLSEETVQHLRDGLASVSRDLNADGRVSVELRQYIAPDTGNSDALTLAQAAQLQLTADIANCESFFFLMEGPDIPEEMTRILSSANGTLLSRGTVSPEECRFLWSDIPALSALDLGPDSDSIQQFYIGRRGFWDRKSTPYAEECAAVWNEWLGSTEDAAGST